jgi:hypothetical protein
MVLAVSPGIFWYTVVYFYIYICLFFIAGMNDILSSNDRHIHHAVLYTLAYELKICGPDMNQATFDCFLQCVNNFHTFLSHCSHPWHG